MKNFKEFILEAEGNFDIINNDLLSDVKAHLLVNYPSDWWDSQKDYIDDLLKEIKKDIIKKFHITEEEYDRNRINEIAREHMNKMVNF